MNRMKKKLLVGFTVVLLFILTACQTISGIDLTKVIVDHLTATSAEGNQSISWKLEIDPKAELEPDEKKMLELLQTGSIELNNYKAQDEKNASVSATLTLGTKKVPFHVYVNDKQLALQVEGLSDIIQLPLSEESSMESIDVDVINRLQEDKEFKNKLATTLISNLPNPAATKVELGQKSVINGEEVSLTKVSTEVKGTDLHEVVIGFVTNLLADEASVKALLETVMSYDDSMTSEDRSTQVDDFMVQFRDTLGQFKEDMTNDDEAIYKMLNNRFNLMKFEIGIDSGLHIRESKTEIYYRIPKIAGQVTLPIRSIRVNVTGQNWNVNGTVTADQPASNSTYIDADTIESPRQFIKQLDHSSVLYDLLKNDMKLAKRNEVFYADNLDLSNPLLKSEVYGQPYINKGTTMIGVRQLAKQMEYSFSWNSTTKKITLKDEANSITFKLGSKHANANGKAIVLSQAPKVIGNLIYIPIRPAAEALQTGITTERDYELTIITLKAE